MALYESMPRELTESNRAVARAVVAAFGVKPKITRYWDDPHRESVDVAEAVDRPEPGLTSYSTVDLSDVPLLVHGVEFETRIEMAGVCRNAWPRFENALSTAAFFVIKDHWFCYPGAVFPDMLAMYDLSPTMRHFFFMDPFLWPSLQESLRLPDRKVSWLMAVPISDQEHRYAEEKGPGALEDLLVEEHDVDVADLRRASVV